MQDAKAQEAQKAFTSMMEQGQAACLFKHVTFKCGNLSCRSLKRSPGFIIKADKGLHTVFVTALSLASQNIGGCQILELFFVH